jgi:hypothetical protein
MKYLNLPKWQFIAVPAVFIMLSIFYFAKYFVADELIYANYAVHALQQDLQDALDMVDAEKARATIAEREADVIRGANAILRGSERNRQDEIASLQADLAFYRRLGGANGSQAPLAVHYMEVQVTQSPRVYRLIFTLTQNLRWAAVISGRIHLEIDGISNGVALYLSDEQLLADSPEPLKFQFKYFQQLERLITLPDGFEANMLTIRLKSRGLRTDVERSMEWGKLFKLQEPDTTPGETSDSSPDD